jgi:hypothetical protein
MSEELSNFLYSQVGSDIRFSLLICVFGGFSLFALFKYRFSTKIGDLGRSFTTLWGQSLFLAYLMPIFLQNVPVLFTEVGNSKLKNTMLTQKIIGIPRMVEIEIPRIVETMIGKDFHIYAFPAASILFSFLCLFVAIFLEDKLAN